MEKTIEIPFGAKDSELKGWEYTIPENMEAEIKDGKIIVKQKESEDEKIRKQLIGFLSGRYALCNINTKDAIAYLEKQKEQKPESCDCSRDEESYMNGIHHVLMNPEAYGLIKQKPASISYNHENDSKPAEWSEEDEINRQIAIGKFEGTEVALEWDIEQRVIKWLKSLRPQPHWKPSKEQMKEYSYWYKNFIESGLASPSSKAVNVLGELLEQLKKL